MGLQKSNGDLADPGFQVRGVNQKKMRRAEGGMKNFGVFHVKKIIRKTADLPMQLCLGTFPRFVAIRFYFLSETLI